MRNLLLVFLLCFLVPVTAIGQREEKAAVKKDSVMFFFAFVELQDGTAVISEIDSAKFDKKDFKGQIKQFELLNGTALAKYVKKNLGSYDRLYPKQSIFVYKPDIDSAKKDFDQKLSSKQGDYYRPPNFKYNKDFRKETMNPKWY